MPRSYRLLQLVFVLAVCCHPVAAIQRRQLHRVSVSLLDMQQQQHANVQLTAVQDRLDVTLVTLDMLRPVCPASVYDSSTCALDLHLRCSGQPDQLVPAFIDDLEGVARVRWRPEGGMVCTGRPLLNQQPVASWSSLPALFVTVMPAPADVTGFATVADNKQYFKDRTSGHLVFPVGMNLAWYEQQHNIACIHT